MNTPHSYTLESSSSIPPTLLGMPWVEPAKDNEAGIEADHFAADVLAGLRSNPMHLPCKYLYDDIGSQLFDQICNLPEYYPTRTEESILHQHGKAIAAVLGRDFALVEFGSGSSRKTRLLLQQVAAASYLPIDISGRQLAKSAARIAACYPALRVHPVCADYTQPLQLPPQADGRRVVYFSGSTIGNFHPEQAIAFLGSMRRLCENDGDILIGVDLRKDADVLWHAYNDAAGITAQFNLNLLRRINRQLGANFNVDQFAHYAPYNAAEGRVEMHLVSRIDQTAWMGDEPIHFRSAQTIRTECSYKYTLEGFAQLAGKANLVVRHVWTDPKQWFSLQHLRPA